MLNSVPNFGNDVQKSNPSKGKMVVWIEYSGI